MTLLRPGTPTTAMPASLATASPAASHDDTIHEDIIRGAYNMHASIKYTALMNNLNKNQLSISMAGGGRARGRSIKQDKGKGKYKKNPSRIMQGIMVILLPIFIRTKTKSWEGVFSLVHSFLIVFDLEKIVGNISSSGHKGKGKLYNWLSLARQSVVMDLLITNKIILKIRNIDSSFRHHSVHPTTHIANEHNGTPKGLIPLVSMNA
ncbi:hypothetical protein Syun_025706 [Stephania yunnanensis]|uniref:Uncharacterized protein n=1 Tax=Stephania yunnanensis TaxID=152371 RepID=A0AAP0ES66_9MAGN